MKQYNLNFEFWPASKHSDPLRDSECSTYMLKKLPTIDIQQNTLQPCESKCPKRRGPKRVETYA
jgi:hypothetical protein